MITDERNEAGNWITAKTTNGDFQMTESYIKWYALKDRCNPHSAHRATHPSYAGSSVAFKDFQAFADWHVKQIGYGMGYVLDKDLLVPGNKTYGEDFCVLIPAALNLFKKSRSRHRTGLPGVHFLKASEKYIAQIWHSKTNHRIGVFDTAQKATEAYEAAKRVEADKWVARLESGEFVVDPRALVVVKGWGSNGNQV